MKKLLLFLSLLSLIPGIKGQEFNNFGLEDIISPYPLSAADLAELINAGYDPATGNFLQKAPAHDNPYLDYLNGDLNEIDISALGFEETSDAPRTFAAPAAPSHTPEASAILYQCSQCYQMFNTQDDLDQHKIDDHSYGVFAAPAAPHKNPSEINLIADSTDTDFNSTQNQPSTELQKNLDSGGTLEPVKGEDGKWRCSYPALNNPSNQCIYTSENKGHVKKHSVTHTGKKLFECDICGNKYSQNSNLLKHIRKHLAAPSKKNSGSDSGQDPDTIIVKETPAKLPTQLQSPTMKLPIMKSSTMELPTRADFKFSGLAPIIPVDHEQPKSTHEQPKSTHEQPKLTTEEEFKKIAEDARRTQAERSQETRRAAVIAHKMITQASTSEEEEEEEEEEEDGDDESYSADPEQDDNQLMVSAKNTTHKKSFQCSEYGETFTQNFTRSEHIRKKHGLREKITEEYQCLFPGCKRSLDSKQGLEIHQRRDHGTTLYDPNQVLSKKLEPVKNKNGLWDCPYQDRKNPSEECPYKNKKLYVIKQHLPKHTGEKNFQCSECKVFFTKDCNCLRHIESTHNGDGKVIQLGIAKAHKCDFTGCTRSFDTKQSLLNHRQEHNQKTS